MIKYCILDRNIRSRYNNQYLKYKKRIKLNVDQA